MANTKASKQEILVTKRNNARNTAVKSKLKTLLKAAKEAITSNDKDVAEKVRTALQAIDKTAAKGILKKQTASRKKSRLMLALNAIKGELKKVASKPAAKAAPKAKTEPKKEEEKTEAKKPTAKKAPAKKTTAKKAAPKTTKKAEPKAEKTEAKDAE